MRCRRIALALAFSAGCAGTPPPPAPPPEPVYACGARATVCGDRFLEGLANRTIADPLANSPVQLVNAVPVLEAVDEAYENDARTVGGSPLTETEYYSLYRRYLYTDSERLLTLAAISAAHRPLADAFEAERCWHWFMDHGGREDGKVAPPAK